ncbi:MAG: hypothetical protein SFU99_23445 [Saprospiraceae bacterium]|nr:hypothetical protein [Saprospiraceae bacterium]
MNISKTNWIIFIILIICSSCDLFNKVFSPGKTKEELNKEINSIKDDLRPIYQELIRQNKKIDEIEDELNRSQEERKATNAMILEELKKQKELLIERDSLYKQELIKLQDRLEEGEISESVEEEIAGKKKAITVLKEEVEKYDNEVIEKSNPKNGKDLTERTWNGLDSGLKKIINEKVFGKRNSIILPRSKKEIEMLWAIDTLNLATSKYPDRPYTNDTIIDFSGLRWFSKLRELDLSGRKLENLDFIIGMPLLETLVIDDTGLTTLSSLKSSNSIRYLYCRRNKLTDLEGIEGLQKLKHLFCQGNNLKNNNGLLYLLEKETRPSRVMITTSELSNLEILEMRKKEYFRCIDDCKDKPDTYCVLEQECNDKKQIK